MEVPSAISGDNHLIHDKICSSLVQLICCKPTSPPSSRTIIMYVLPGAVVLSESNYCHVIVLWKEELRSTQSSNWSFRAIFHDGTKVMLRREDVEVRGELAAFSVHKSMRVNPVEFSTEEAIRNEEIYSVGFYQNASQPSHIVPGRVTDTRNGFFSHDSPPYPLTAHGDLVFNRQAQLVGISCKDSGVTIALNVSFTTKLLAMFLDDVGMMGEPLSRILKCIKHKGKSQIKGKKISGSRKRKTTSC